MKTEEIVKRLRQRREYINDIAATGGGLKFVKDSLCIAAADALEAQAAEIASIRRALEDTKAPSAVGSDGLIPQPISRANTAGGAPSNPKRCPVQSLGGLGCTLEEGHEGDHTAIRPTGAP